LAQKRQHTKIPHVLCELAREGTIYLLFQVPGVQIVIVRS